ncbi:SUN domain-containing protein 1-like isoform X2 [Acanthopagrus latus]|uniref:SUN domain-containing protein 1-like isoform X2 n=1 Tax=Acanthopagrus latus TaxID=8177 RepID=UPI00187C2314|nr:SUN domain-containing protein 1-like isoform X2 [Acanthopagrus latus]
MCVCVCVCAGPLFPGMSCEEDVDLQSWGWTNLSSYSSAALDSEKEQLIVSTMSRRSLRLDDGLLDRGLPHSSASFSVGGPSWRSSRSMKSRRSQQLSVSCSESLLLSTPRKLAAPSLLNSSVASDASLLSSLLDDSSVQESTMVDTFWGLDHDGDAKESTIIAEHSTILADGTLIGSDCPKHPVQTLSQVYCKDCELQSDRKESTHCASSKYTCASSAVTGPRPGPSGTGDQDTSTIYCRDRSRKNRTDVLQLWLGSCLLCVRRAAACCVSVLTHTWQVCYGLASKCDNRHGARSSHCGVMTLRESTKNHKELHPTGSLCDDCQEKQPSDMDTVSSSSSSSSSSWSSVASCVLGLMWSAAVFTASCLSQLTLAAASAVWPLTKRTCSTCRSVGGSAGATAADVYRWLNRRWHHMTASIFLTRFPLRLLLVLVPLLLLFSLCWFCSAGLQSVLPAVSEWRAGVPDVPALSSIYSFMSPRSQSAEGAVQPYEEPLYSRPPPAETPSAKEEASAAASADEATRLVHLEQSLAALWDRVDVGGRQAERRHEEVLRLYADLQQQQVSGQSSGEEVWLSELLQQQLEQLQARLDEDRRQREQTRQQDLSQQQSQASRLDQLELQLQSLAAKTEEVQWRQEAAAPSSTLPAAVSVGVDRQSHDALLAVVARLEAALEDLRRDVTGLSGCRDGCRHLDRIQQMISDQVSVQVREEVRTLVYGNQLTVGGGASGDQAGLPESLLQWLSQQYVSGADLQASLSSLELRILQNISLQLEQHRSEETVTEAVLHAAEAAGASVTREDVHVIVQNALRLFSQDRTGLADYALESGGGSILSTRCSETYETKAALLSLFGVPLWYFSQSPRAVIQPDVHPGSCWAFRGSKGFLVIRLSMRILPTAFSLEHIPKALAPSGTLRSAPRDFRVYGLDDESQERGELLGTYTYDEDGEALQTYPVTEESDRAFQVIEVQVLSNWGHPDYTCMYRFRVHGTPGDL